MSPQTNSSNTSRSTCSRESEDSHSRSNSQTLGEIAQSLRAAFRAKTSRPPVREQDSKASEADSGGKRLQPLASYDQMSSSWRMCLPSLFEDSKLFSGRWPRSGIVSNGIAYQLDTLAHRTKGIASGLSESEMWPTPRATEYKNPGMSRSKREKGMPPENLTEAVKMWPTPTGSDHKGSGPTLIRKDGKDRSFARLDYATEQVTDKGGGALSADWVSILMGYDLDWTTVVEDGSAASQGSQEDKRTEPKD